MCSVRCKAIACSDGERKALTRCGGVQVCQHHAAAVADGSGCAQILRCSYHGWEYGRTPLLLLSACRESEQERVTGLVAVQAVTATIAGIVCGQEEIWCCCERHLRKCRAQRKAEEGPGSRRDQIFPCRQGRSAADWRGEPWSSLLPPFGVRCVASCHSWYPTHHCLAWSTCLGDPNRRCVSACCPARS